MGRELSQQEIDKLFRGAQPRDGEGGNEPKAVPYDFRRLDRIPKSQLRAIRLLHDNFVRNLASSLSAYLRTYLAVSLVSVEQLSYAEFLAGLASPTCLVSLGLRPFEGNAVLEMNPNLTFPILELLLGGKGKTSGGLSREITEIERQLMLEVLRVVLKDLKEAWETITSIDFQVESMATEPQLLQVLDPGEAFVATGIEIRIGGILGMLNLAFPSLIIKMMRGKFDHPGAGRRSPSTEAGQARLLSLVRPAQLDMDVRLLGPKLALKDLLALEGGDLLPFDIPMASPLDCMVNGKLKFRGQVVRAGNKKAFLLEDGATELA